MIQLSAKTRHPGKETSQLRHQNQVPAVLYGRGIKNVNLSVDEKIFEKVLKEAGESTLVDLIADDKKPIKVLIYDVARNPVSDKAIHVDFYQVRMDEKIKTKIQLEFVGQSAAIKEFGGVLVKSFHELEIEALPQDLIHQIEVDISKIKTFEDHVLVKDLALPAGIKVMASLDEIVASVVAPREEEVVVKEEPKIEDIKVVSEEKKAAKAEKTKEEAEAQKAAQ